MDQAEAALLDFTKPFECELLDQIVSIANDGSHPNRAAADEFLVKLRENPEIWKRTFDVLEQSKLPATKFFIMQAMSHMINTRWNILPGEQKQQVREYIVTKILSYSATDELLKEHSKFLTGSMNTTLVQILKQDWPHAWPDFISDIVASSKTSESLCENNMRILRMLSEDVFDFSEESLTAAKIKNMKEAMMDEFVGIHQLCQLVIENSQKVSLVLATLQTLQRFLSWIPPGYIFETSLLPNLLKFIKFPAFRTTVLDCLTEVANLPPSEMQENHQPMLISVLVELMDMVLALIPPETDLCIAYDRGTDEERLFISRLAMFLSTYMKNFLCYLDVFGSTDTQNPKVVTAVEVALQYLLKISKIKAEDDEIFKITLDFWGHFAKELYTSELQKGFLRDKPGTSIGNTSVFSTGMHGSGGMGSGLGASQSVVQRRFARPLQELRVVMIDHMAKPEEVIVVENEDGDIVREMNKDLEVIAQYKTMREAIVLLTNLNYEETECIMLEKLDLQVSSGKFTWLGLNTLCWAIGSISGAMSEVDEKRFLVIVIKDLLRLCEHEKKKDDKAVVASNIMYIVGQYPRFLRAHWKFLKTVVNKLFEFMHEHHPGVQDMACDTFLKISTKCKRKFMTPQTEQPEPFICTLIKELNVHTVDLQPHQVLSFYESVGTMLSDHGTAIQLSRAETIVQLMELENTQWRRIFEAAANNLSVLADPECIKVLTKCLKVNTRVCRAVGTIYMHQLTLIFLELLNLHQWYSKEIHKGVAAEGPIAVKQHRYKIMRQLKSEILELLIAFFESFEAGKDMSSQGKKDFAPATIMNTFMPPIMDEVLSDYKNCQSCARDSKVLTLFATAITTFKEHLTPDVPRIMGAVFESTLEVITSNMLDHPEHRSRFFRFLQSANEHCFYGLFSIPPQQQKMVIDSVVWAVKHTTRDISETGLEILQALLSNVAHAATGRSTQAGAAGVQFAQEFYSTFLVALIADMVAVMTDRLHKSGFKIQSTILMSLFHVVQGGSLVVPLFDTAQYPNFNDNASFLKEHVGQQILAAFPNLSKQQVIAFVSGCFDPSLDIFAFKQHMRDFLINVKEYAAGDRNEELYDEEKKLAQDKVSDELLAYQKSIPGLLKPSEIDDNDADHM